MRLSSVASAVCWLSQMIQNGPSSLPPWRSRNGTLSAEHPHSLHCWSKQLKPNREANSLCYRQITHDELRSGTCYCCCRKRTGLSSQYLDICQSWSLSCRHCVWLPSCRVLHPLQVGPLDFMCLFIAFCYSVHWLQRFRKLWYFLLSEFNSFAFFIHKRTFDLCEHGPFQDLHWKRISFSPDMSSSGWTSTAASACYWIWLGLCKCSRSIPLGFMLVSSVFARYRFAVA